MQMIQVNCFSGVNTSQIISKANHFVKNLNAWALSNSLQINVGEVESAKKFGVILIKAWFGKKMVQYTCNELSKTVGTIYRLSQDSQLRYGTHLPLYLLRS